MQHGQDLCFNLRVSVTIYNNVRELFPIPIKYICIYT